MHLQQNYESRVKSSCFNQTAIQKNHFVVVRGHREIKSLKVHHGC